MYKKKKDINDVTLNRWNRGDFVNGSSYYPQYTATTGFDPSYETYDRYFYDMMEAHKNPDVKNNYVLYKHAYICTLKTRHVHAVKRIANNSLDQYNRNQMFCRPPAAFHVLFCGLVVGAGYGFSPQKKDDKIKNPKSTCYIDLRIKNAIYTP